MKHVGYLLLIMLIFIIQTTFINAIAIVGVKPNLLLIAVVLIGFLKGEYDGLFVGCIAGLFHDSFFSTYIGGNIFLYGVIGYIVGIICREYYKGNVITPMIVVSLSTLGYGFGNFVLNVLLQGFTNLGYYLFIKIVPEIVYSSIFTIFAYIIAYALYNKFEYRIKTRKKVF